MANKGPNPMVPLYSYLYLCQTNLPDNGEQETEYQWFPCIPFYIYFRPFLLSMANEGPNTNGSLVFQTIFITDHSSCQWRPRDRIPTIPLYSYSQFYLFQAVPFVHGEQRTEYQWFSVLYSYPTCSSPRWDTYSLRACNFRYCRLIGKFD